MCVGVEPVPNLLELYKLCFTEQREIHSVSILLDASGEAVYVSSSREVVFDVLRVANSICTWNF